MNNSQKTLSLLGARLGLELAFDTKNLCRLALDEQQLISIKNYDSEWLLIGNLITDVMHQEKEFWVNLLVLNLSLAKEQCGMICYDHSNDCLLYLNRLTINQPEEDLAYEKLESHFIQMQKITQQIFMSKFTNEQ